jgi:predicted component of type VI protein secretion system
MPTCARIEVVSGNATGTWLEVTGELLIGRHADAVGRLGDDEQLSRYHARLRLGADGSCVVEDLGSTNGTIVNGAQISAPQMLQSGDRIELGASTLVVRELPAPAGAEPAGDSPTETRGHAGEPEAEPTPTVPRLSLRVEIDFDANEAMLWLGDGDEPMRIVLESGAWRVA